eukprot:2183441-Pleurochrysis_carterae.AAC.1
MSAQVEIKGNLSTKTQKPLVAVASSERRVSAWNVPIIVDGQIVGPITSCAWSNVRFIYVTDMT